MGNQRYKIYFRDKKLAKKLLPSSAAKLGAKKSSLYKVLSWQNFNRPNQRKSSCSCNFFTIHYYLFSKIDTMLLPEKDFADSAFYAVLFNCWVVFTLCFFAKFRFLKNLGSIPFIFVQVLDQGYVVGFRWHFWFWLWLVRFLDLAIARQINISLHKRKSWRKSCPWNSLLA